MLMDMYHVAVPDHNMDATGASHIKHKQRGSFTEAVYSVNIVSHFFRGEL